MRIRVVEVELNALQLRKKTEIRSFCSRQHSGTWDETPALPEHCNHRMMAFV
jgi:hypothetical protein